MSEKFTASNGVDVTVTAGPDGTYLLGKGGVIEGGDRRWTVCTGNSEGMDALREFFLHERDQELGRWRDTDFQNMVCYPTEHGVTVVNEVTGAAEPWTRAQAGHDWNRDVAGFYTATRYFAAHPVRKPWHDAEPGEVWSVKVKDWDTERMFVFAPFEGSYHFQSETETHIPVTDERIVAAVRIYPEEGEQ